MDLHDLYNCLSKAFSYSGLAAILGRFMDFSYSHFWFLTISYYVKMNILGMINGVWRMYEKSVDR